VERNIAGDLDSGEFDAFISYSRKDGRTAERLSRRIRRYSAPRLPQLKRRRLRVFRDVERLTAGPDVSKALAERVDSSRWLALLA